VLEPRPETTTIELLLIPKQVTEDVLLVTRTSFNAESMVDQTRETSVLRLMLNAQAFHGDHTMSELVRNSESLEKVGLKEEVEDNGDHSPHTTSGITTTVPLLCAKILDLVLVQEPKPETSTTLLTSTQKLVTEDVLLHTRTSSNAEDMVDQTKMTRVLKLM
jgi:hypothetical protein